MSLLPVNTLREVSKLFPTHAAALEKALLSMRQKEGQQ